jgi:hypothetical protein
MILEMRQRIDLLLPEPWVVVKYMRCNGRDMGYFRFGLGVGSMARLISEERCMVLGTLYFF